MLANRSVCQRWSIHSFEPSCNETLVESSLSLLLRTKPRWGFGGREKNIYAANYLLDYRIGHTKQSGSLWAGGVPTLQYKKLNEVGTTRKEHGDTRTHVLLHAPTSRFDHTALAIDLLDLNGGLLIVPCKAFNNAAHAWSSLVPGTKHSKAAVAGQARPIHGFVQIIQKRWSKTGFTSHAKQTRNARQTMPNCCIIDVQADASESALQGGTIPYSPRDNPPADEFPTRFSTQRGESNRRAMRLRKMAAG